MSRQTIQKDEFEQISLGGALSLKWIKDRFFSMISYQRNDF